MRSIVIGSGGMLGSAMTSCLSRADFAVVAAPRSTELDITDPAALEALPAADVVINCAAYTAVDAAETDESAAFAVNAVGTGNLARWCAEQGARFVTVSTDYVFRGDGDGPYPEDAPMAPQSAYGRTKAAGEWAARAEHEDSLIVRTAWLYGNGKCFPRTIARLLRERDEVSVVSDQQGQPTWTVDVAALIVRLLEAHAPSGIYHGTADGSGTWFDLARAVAASIGEPTDKVRETTAAAFAAPAPRPSNSVLSHGAIQALGVTPIGQWRQRWDVASTDVLGS